MRFRISHGCVLLIVMAICFTACEKAYVVPPDVPPTVKVLGFANDIVPLFEQHCNASGCHNTGGIAPDLTAANAYADLFSYGLIDTVNAASSELYIRMNTVTSPMPTTGKLPQDQVDLVLTWISQGALDN